MNNFKLTLHYLNYVQTPVWSRSYINDKNHETNSIRIVFPNTTRKDSEKCI